VLAVLIGFLEVSERWKERLSRTRTTTKDEDDLVASSRQAGLLVEPVVHRTRPAPNRRLWITLRTELLI
jgi:hypothetical protein